MAIMQQNYLVSYSTDHCLNIWSLQSMKLVSKISTQETAVSEIVPLDRLHFLTTSADPAVRLWDFKRGVLRKVINLEGNAHGGALVGKSSKVLPMCSTPILIVSLPRALFLYNYYTGKVLRQMKGPNFPCQHQQWIKQRNSLLLINQQFVEEYNVIRGEKTRSINIMVQNICSFQYLYDQSTLVLLNAYGEIKVYSYTKNLIIFQDKIQGKKGNRQLCYLQDGKHFLVSQNDHKLQLFQLRF